MTDQIKPKDHTKEQLLEIAAERNVDVPASATKAEIAEALNADGSAAAAPAGPVEPADHADAVGVNPDYEIPDDAVVIQTQKAATPGTKGRLVQNGPLPQPTQPEKAGLSDIERVALGLEPK